VQTVKRAIKGLFHGVGLDVRGLRYTEEGILKDLLRVLQPVAVLDVGANVGQFAQMVRRTGYKGAIVSFEALPSAHENLTARASQDPHWKVAPCVALGRSSGSAEINVAGNSVSSSLLAMREQHVEAAPESRYVDRRVVPIESLDTLLPSVLQTPGDLYLKIDTQGYEEEVLRGSQQTLPRVSAVQLEVSLIQLYDDAPSLLEIFTLMEELQFEPFQIIPGFRSEPDGRLLQFDAIFVRPHAAA
jgi:FkbM family methyltransferase